MLCKFSLLVCILKIKIRTYTFMHKELEINMSRLYLYYMINLINAAPH
jgi:hypothetical protein